MDILELDERLDKDLDNLEKNLRKHDSLLKEATTLKETYIKLTQDLSKSFEIKTKKIILDYEHNINKISTYISEIELSKKNINGLLKIINEKKIQLDNILKNIFQNYDDKWQQLLEVNTTRVKSLEEKVTSKIQDLESENKKELLKVINALTVHEKEIVNSKNEMSKFISDEIYTISQDITQVDKNIILLQEHIKEIKINAESIITSTDERFQEVFIEIKKINKDIKEMKDNNALEIGKVNENIININKALNLKLQQDYEELNNKLTKLNKKTNLFSAINFTIMIVTIIIILIGR